MRLDTFAPGCYSELLEHPTLSHPVSPIRVSALDATQVTRSDEQGPCDRDCMVTLACALFIAFAQIPPDRAFSSGRVWLSKLWSLFGYPKYEVPYYNRDPKRDQNFDIHPRSGTLNPEP